MKTGPFTQSREIKKEIVVTYARCLLAFFLILVLSMIIVRLFVGIEDVESLFRHIFMDTETGSSPEAKKLLFDYWFHNSITNLI